jgi:hypothetical protein
MNSRRGFSSSKYSNLTQKYYSELKFLKVKATVEKEFNLEESKKNLIVLLKKILGIDKLSLLYVKNTECQVHSTLDEFKNVNQNEILGDLNRLTDSLEVGKPTEITKQASKYVNLQKALKITPFNFAIKIKREYLDSVQNVVYVFHLQYQSLKILFEK